MQLDARTLRCLMGLLLFCLVPTLVGCQPTRRRVPVKVTVPSANGQFAVESDPDAKTVTVFANGKMDEPLWIFEHDIQLDQCFVSDDGENVAVVFWPRQPVGGGGVIALRFWNREKGEARTWQLDEVCPNFQGVGQHAGIMSKSPDPSPWAEKPAVISGDILTFKTIDCHDCEFSVTTGEQLRRERFFTGVEKFLFGLGIICVGGVVLVIGVVVWTVMLSVSLFSGRR